MTRARFIKHARSELLAQIACYEAVQQGLGQRFLSEVEAAALRAASFPLHGRPSPAGTRRRPIANFPFSLFYTQTDYGVLISMSTRGHGLAAFAHPAGAVLTSTQRVALPTPKET